MLVLKFGGTSVGSAAAFRNAAALVERVVPRDPVVVVSALAGVTDLLVRFAAEPAARRDLAARFVTRHEELARELGVQAMALEDELAAWDAAARDCYEIGMGSRHATRIES
jgi:aspartate kinase